MQTFKTIPLSIIIVHYGKNDHLFECLHSLSISGVATLGEVIIVNNNTKRLPNAFRIFSFIREIALEKNIGFGSAANVGARIANGTRLFFLNPDTRILLADTLDRISQKGPHQRKKGIIGGGLLNENYHREPWGGGKATRLWDILAKRLFLYKGTLSYQHKVSTVDWVSGASLSIEKDIFLSVGGFDEKFFLYFEDMDLCLRVARYGAACYDGTIKILHYGGKSFSEKAEQKRHYFTSQKHYFHKHRPHWESRALEWLHTLFLKK